MRSFSGRPGLTRDEEIELAARIARGDHQARNRMVQANLGLVGRIALAFRHRGLSLDDLIGEGNLGLIRAAEEFDPRFQTRFSTYASYWIKEAIYQALINTTATIRVPARMVGLLTRWRRAERSLGRTLGAKPSIEAIASSLGLTEIQKGLVARALDAGRLRLECSFGDGAGAPILNGVTDRHRVDELVEAEDERAAARRLMDRLDDRERSILNLRFGLEGEILTLKEIAHRLGVSAEWVRKIEARALRKLNQSRGVDAVDAGRPDRLSDARRPRPSACLPARAMKGAYPGQWQDQPEHRPYPQRPQTAGRPIGDRLPAGSPRPGPSGPGRPGVGGRRDHE